MSLLPRLRLWARRQASLIWLLALAYAAMPLAQALQPQAQWVEMPYCAGAVSATSAQQAAPGAQHESALQGVAEASGLGAEAAGHGPAHAHLLVLFTPNACPAGSGPQTALPTGAAFLPVITPCAACAAPRQDTPKPVALAYSRPQTRAPPAENTAA
ncbi:hypothetical protein GALL_393560 [mine drainage metagenome]|uniref:Uncharacterized protein n=1 Tax=mine drainage metagenome TaxID=410659 RepID=A0A1J5Q5J9_9ZZZZ